MKFKGVGKKDTIKKKIPQKIGKGQKKSDLKREEIKEVVRETIEELAQEPDEKAIPQIENQTKEKITSEESSLMHSADNNVATPLQENTQESSVPSLDSSAMSSASASPTQEADIPLLPTVPVDTTTVVTASSASEDSASDTKNTGGYVKKLLFLALSAIVIVVVALGVFWYVTTHNLLALKAELLHTSQVTPTVVKATPTPTPKPVNLSAYTITVLNGSYLSGEAAKAKTLLTTAGFSVGSIGNASMHTATDTVIAAKSTVAQTYLSKLTQTLQNTYVVSQQVQTLPISATSDVVVTIGSSLH